MSVGRVLLVLAFSWLSGCALIPSKTHQPQFHNPWPQLEKVAVAPFYNLSNEPTVNQDAVAEAYYSQLQQIPGFEVVPVGVTKLAMLQYGIRGASGQEFQQLARAMGVDAVVVGTINEYTPYYPPRLALSVRWYAANPGFHPIPAGYGLPWGRAEEEFIPSALVHEAERELAKAQLATQTPLVIEPAGASDQPPPRPNAQAQLASQATESLPDRGSGERSAEQVQPGQADVTPDVRISEHATGHALPAYWPDPRGFIPPGPSPVRPIAAPNYGPILSVTRSYDGHDSDFTEALASYYESRDEARFGGWQAYLQRSDDFIRFCCYMHITEMLAARGGGGETKVVYRWPISRYHP